jgi:molybdopterin-binding protein
MSTDGTLRIGQAASLLNVSVDTLRRWEEDGDLAVERTKGGQRVVAVTEVHRLLRKRRTPRLGASATSARNQMEATVVRVVADAAAATVEMQAGPFRLVALTTAESVEELGLVPGLAVIASVKAPSVIVNLPPEG